MTKFLTVIMLLLSAYGCNSNKNSRLEYALEFAGDNRGELEKVLAHYHNDTLRLEAAHFLIENMPHYFSYNDENQQVYDCRVITSDYLIENIALAFDTWQTRPWSRNYSFDQFCEFILPYRIEFEPLDNWRRIYHDHYQAYLDAHKCSVSDDVIDHWAAVCEAIKKEGFVDKYDMGKVRKGADHLFKNRIGSCREQTDLLTYAMRSVGIPVTNNYYVFSPDFRFAHNWTDLIDTTGRPIPFWYGDHIPLTRETTDRRCKGKAYRMCYGVQPEKYSGLYDNKYIPKWLKDPYLQDVTAEHFGENRIDIELECKSASKFAYLGVFSNKGWVPIDVAPLENGKVTFVNIEQNLIYQPLVSMSDRTIVPCGNAFLFDGTKAQYFKDNTSCLTEIKPLRKFTRREQSHFYLRVSRGSVIEGANSADFKDAKILHTVTDTFETNYYNAYISEESKFRYIRYSSTKSNKIELAELTCYIDSAGKVPLMANVSGSAPVDQLRNVIDNDPLSYYESESEGGHVILDYGKPQTIRKIVYTPRNDDNYIRIGDRYELFYQHGAKGWISLGQQTANTNELIYSNAPMGALFWLRDLTRGDEEQVFYFKDGKQMFPSNVW